MANQPKYFLHDNFTKKGEAKWLMLLDRVIPSSDMIAFNILYLDQELPDEIQSLSDSLIRKEKTWNKVYPNGNYTLFYEPSQKVIEFVKSKKYSDWNGYELEDISIYLNGSEILATNTHEDYVFMKLTEFEKTELNDLGYDFEFDCGTDPAGANMKRHENSLGNRIKKLFGG